MTTDYTTNEKNQITGLNITVNTSEMTLIYRALNIFYNNHYEEDHKQELLIKHMIETLSEVV